MNGADVRMTQCGEQSGFALESPHARSVSGHRAAQHLDRHIAAQPKIASTINVSHAAAAEQGDDFVDADTVARREGHVSLRII